MLLSPCFRRGPINCSSLPLFYCEGSYDEHLRFWDERNLKKELESVCVGGGIWRIKQQPEGAGSGSDGGGALLVAAMHGGFLVLERDSGAISRFNTSEADGAVDPTGTAFHTTVAARYTEHESLAYGADWLGGEGGGLVATCSFYDHMMRIWTY